jgi:hypothetical protein
MTKIQATRKQLYVVESTPAISIDADGYVRCGLSEKMEDNDKLVLAICLSLKNEAWKKKMLAAMDKHFVGKTTRTSRMVTAFSLIQK